jgi:hypothetical protein
MVGIGHSDTLQNYLYTTLTISSAELEGRPSGGFVDVWVRTLLG